jgi:hypothetical protein
MAKSKGAKSHVSETAIWIITILTLAISCAALAMLISENRELQAENEVMVTLSQ